MARTQYPALQENHRLQELEWILQRVGWGVWGILISAGLAGLLGDGPLCSRSITSSDGALTLSYQRYEHVGAPAQLNIRLNRQETTDSQFKLSVSREFWEAIEMQRIQPEPLRCETTSKGVRLTFGIDRDVTNADLQFHIEYKKFGNVSAALQLEHGPELQFTQFIYP